MSARYRQYRHRNIEPIPPIYDEDEAVETRKATPKPVDVDDEDEQTEDENEH